MNGPELVFLHIPKTAGTSQQREFNQYIGRDHVFWIGRDCPAGVLRYPRSRIGVKPVVGGHKYLSFYPASLDPLYTAILRDPIERAISLFVFYTRPELASTEHDKKSRVSSLRAMLRKGIDPDSIVNSIRSCRPFREEISNFQCRYLSRGKPTFAGVCQSLRNRDHLVGTVTRYDRFRSELWGLLGRSEVSPLTANRSRDNYAAPFLEDEALLALIAELNQEDRKLVEWVESEHQGLWLNLVDADERKARLQRLPRVTEPREEIAPKWDDAANYWPARGSRKLQWPLSRTMLAEPQRLLYMPNPGVVDRPIQRMMLRHSGARHADVILALGIDRVVERFATGLMLHDRSEEDIAAIATSADYFRFAIVYHPVSRLVDLYRQRVVAAPDSLSRWPRFPDMMAGVDPALGLTFRQFVEAVTSGRFNHRLWLPQVRYLPWAAEYDRLYRPDQLPQIERDLARLRGLSVTISAPEMTVIAGSQGGRHADTPARQLPADPAEWLNELADEAIAARIKGYYARDFNLYNGIVTEDMEVAS